MPISHISDSGLSWFAGVVGFEPGYYGQECVMIAVGHGIPTDTGLGAEYTGNGFARAAGTPSINLPNLIVSHEFTADGADIQITEAALYDNHPTTPKLIGTLHFGEYELRNGGVVPDGESCTITIQIAVVPGIVARTVDDVSPRSIHYALNVALTLTGGTDIIPGDFSCERGKICFNGRVVPEGSIDGETHNRGGWTWNISGVTQDESYIRWLRTQCAPLSVGKTITGLQHVSSVMLPGVFKVWNTADQSHDIHNYCWINGDISVTRLGDNFVFSFQIIQDFRGGE